MSTERTRPPKSLEVREWDRSNAELWDHWTAIHEASPFYDVERFRRGHSTLKPIETEALGDVEGRSILHLQCHFGLDTLSLSRAGACVTGADYSPESIARARDLSEELGLPARFVCSNIYDLGERLGERFDIVFTSYGVLHWLHDLGAWGRVIAERLRPGGRFFMVEFHPLFNMLDESGERFVFPYFASGEPVETVKKGTCVDPTTTEERVAFEWPHSLSEIVMALIDAGLVIDSLREYPYMFFGCLPYLERVAEGRYAPVPDRPRFPLMFSLDASLPGS